jgi:hypothetical protein
VKVLALSITGALSIVSGAATHAHAQVARYCDGATIPYGLKAGIDSGSEYRLDPVDRAADGHQVRYDNMQNNRRYFVANQYVKGVELATNNFVLESGYDFLTIGTEQFSGTAPWSTRQFYTTYSFQANPLLINFKTDESVTRTGFVLNSVRPICGTNGYNGDATPSLPAFASVDGVVLGGNDVVHMSFPANFFNHATIALWVPSAQDADLDILAACGRRPSLADHDLSSRTGGNIEFVHINNYCAGAWHVAVHSYNNASKSGRATFRLLYSQHYAAQDVKKTVGWKPVSTDPAQIAVEQAQIAGYLSRRAADIFGASDGQVLMSYKLFQVPGGDQTNPWSETWTCGGAACDVRMMPPGGAGGGQGHFASGRMWLGNDYWGNEVSAGGFLHEWGHSHLGLGVHDTLSGWDGYAYDSPIINKPWFFPRTAAAGDDEIADTIYDSCGHSVMSNGWLPRVRTFCQAHNHQRNQRYVQQGNEGNIMMNDGSWDEASPAGTEAYSLAISLDGFAQSYTPVEHSEAWTATSDYGVAYARGIFLYNPSTYTDDTFDFQAFVGFFGFPNAAP